MNLFFWRKKPQSDYDAIFQIAIHVMEKADETNRYVMMARLSDYFIDNMRLLPVKTVKQLKHKLIDFDARAGVWKDSAPPCVGEE